MTTGARKSPAATSTSSGRRTAATTASRAQPPKSEPVRGTARRGHPVDRVVGSIGPKVRELRLQRGLSLQQLAERSDVSPAAIHKVERNGMVPTIATLMKLAVALNRPVSYFIDEDVQDSPTVYTPSGGGRPVFTSKAGMVLQSVTGPYGRFSLAGAVAVIDPGADSGPRPMEHPGEELVYLLQGTFEIEVGGETFRLRPGDAFHFRTDRAHRWRNPGAQPAKAVWMTQRPT